MSRKYNRLHNSWTCYLNICMYQADVFFFYKSFIVFWKQNIVFNLMRRKNLKFVFKWSLIVDVWHMKHYANHIFSAKLMDLICLLPLQKISPYYFISVCIYIRESYFCVKNSIFSLYLLEHLRFFLRPIGINLYNCKKGKS